MQGLWTPPHKPPSRGMHASSSRFAPMSSARTPARVGFYVMWACKWLASTSFCDSPKVWNFPFANRSLVRSTDGGCAARQHRSEATGGGRRTRQRGGISHNERQINWNLTPINRVALLCHWGRTPPLKPPSRGMQASSSRFAPMSSARTPTRVGFHGMWVCKWLTSKGL